MPKTMGEQSHCVVVVVVLVVVLVVVVVVCSKVSIVFEAPKTRSSREILWISRRAFF